MKRRSSISLGPGAASLLLIFVVLAMSVLGMLSLMNSRNDIRLSERSVAVTEAVYSLNVKAEETRARLDAVLYGLIETAKDDETYFAAVEEALSEQVNVSGRRLSWDETDGARTVHCALEVLPLGSAERTRWTRHILISRTAESFGDAFETEGREAAPYDWDELDVDDFELDDDV